MLLKKNSLWRKKPEHIEGVVLWFLVFLAPSQLIRHFWPSWSLVFGVRVDYLSLSISLSEVLIFILFVFWFLRIFVFNKRKFKRIVFLFFNPWFLGVFFLFLINIFFGDYKFNIFFSWLKVFFLIWLFYYLIFFNGRKFSEWFYRPAFFSLLFFSLLAVGQFVKGSTINLWFYWLGERNFSKNTPGIALVSLMGRDFLRAYSTFSHPNSLAGYFGVFLLLFLGFVPKNTLERFLKTIVLVFTFLVFLLSFSKTAFFAIIFCLLVLFISKSKNISRKFAFWFVTLIFLFSLFSMFAPDIWNKYIGLSNNIRERFYLLLSARDVFLKHPMFGVGLNNFILATSYTFDVKTINYQLQPVHNIYLLVLSELGLLGFLFFYLVLLKVIEIANSFYKPWFFLALAFVIISGMADHYWLTLIQNRLSLVFLFAGIFQEWKKKKL